MKRLLSAGLFGLFSFLYTFSQTNQSFPEFNKLDLPDAKFLPERTYKRESLYGYIDGGADLYLEYGFAGVTISEFSYLKGKYKIEIFKMNDPESAYGIFSVSRFRCSTRPAISAYTCQNKYQLQICSGPYYISIINESGTGADSAASLMIGRKIVKKISESSADLTAFFPGISPETVTNESCLVKGRLGVINGVPDLDSYFKGMNGYTALILNITGKTLISIRFKDKDAMESFGAFHNWEPGKLSEKAFQMKGGERVRQLKENLLLIEIPPIK
jgi:hypothetical protein